MQLTFFDPTSNWSRMLPLTYTRPVADLRIGILKIQEKWINHLHASEVYYRTEEYLKPLFKEPSTRSLTILGSTLPSEGLVKSVSSLTEDEVLLCDDEIIAGYFEPNEPVSTDERRKVSVENVRQIRYPWDIFRMNGEEIRNDYALLTSGRKSKPLTDPHTKTYGNEIFLEEGVKIRAAILNAENGPIYVGKHADIQEGALIKGPFSLGEYSIVNMGSKMRGDITVGPHSKVGGEVSNSVIQGYSNKGHEGYLGNSVVGEWCNLGADTNNSNLKNNYANVKMWDYSDKRFRDTNLQFCGLVMGDHSKCGINTMFNTGTSVGVSSNIFGEGFPRTIIPSFAWGGASGFSTYKTNRAFETARLVMKRKGKDLSESEQAVLSHVFELTSEYRVWEKK